MATLKICMFLGILLATIAADIIVEDWFSQELKNISTLVINKQSATGYESRLGYIRHWSGGKFIHPYGYTGPCPGDSIDLIIHQGIYTNGKTSFKFVQVEGDYGYIRHSCGKYLQPKHQHMRPSEGTKVALHGDRHAGALFFVDEKRNLIVHRGGGLLSPVDHDINPPNNNQLTIRYGRNDGRRFEFVDYNFKPFSVYPKPSLSGRWVRLFAVLNPAAKEYKYTINYKVGKSVSRSTTKESSWEVSPSVEFEWFSTSVEYSQSVSITDSETWNEEIGRQLSITVERGETVVVWQYVFEANQFGDGLRFRSTIIGNTKNVNSRPPIM